MTSHSSCDRIKRLKKQTYVYTYDNAGNITSKKTYSLTAASSEPSGTPTTTTYGKLKGSHLQV